jgi:hypothetical protein
MVEPTKYFDEVSVLTQPRRNAKGFASGHCLLLGIFSYLLTACGPASEPTVVNPAATVVIVPTAAIAVLPTGSNSTVLSPSPAALLDYAMGSEEKMVFDAINVARNACGFGAVYRNESLDFAIGGHMGYLLQNNVWGHTETKLANFGGFVGVTPAERAQSKGYSGSVGEALVGRITNYQGGGVRGLGGLTTAAYHLVDLFRPYGDIGLIVSQAGTSNLFSGNVTLGIQYGYARRSAALGVRSYPCNGVTVLETKTYATEWPNPLPSRDVGLQPLGHPVFFRGSENNRLTLSSAEIRLVNSILTLNIAILNSDNDPNKILQPWEAVLIPLQTLQPNSAYEVKIIGQDGGLSFEQRFVFQTAGF